MKWKSLSLGVILLIAGLIGCNAVAPKRVVSSRSLHKFSRRSRYELRKVTLTKTQQEKINQILDNQIPVEEVVKYYNVRKWKGQGVTGDVFVISGKAAYGSYKILALVRQRSIVALVQDKPVLKNGYSVINQEFLGQFVGKTLEQPFEVASSLNDVLQTPTKVRPIANEVELSKEIALKVKKALAEAVVLKTTI